MLLVYCTMLRVRFEVCVCAAVMCVAHKHGVLDGEKWTLVYTNGSAKQVRGWWQAGYGAWFGVTDNRNLGLPVPDVERQSMNREALYGLLYALERRRVDEKMVAVLDSKYVYKGIAQWSPKWYRHAWR